LLARKAAVTFDLLCEMTLRLRSILFCGGLFLFASTTFAQGEYQQAKDGKTLIWNGTPKPGEIATWDGDRDKENYATGFGALTWYTPKGTVYGLYYGNMVHGKLEGPVNVHINGRTAHAYFVDGGRATAWGRGRAPSKMAVPEEVIVEKRKVQAEKEAAAAKRVAAAAEAEKKAKIEAEKARSVEAAASKPEPKPEDRAQKSETSSVEKLAPEEPKKESPPAVAEKKSESPTTASPTRVFDEPTPLAKPEIATQKSEPTQLPTAEPSVTASAVNEPPREEVATEPKTEVPESSPASTKKESPRDVSLNSLVGPPSSLRMTTEASPPKMETETSTSRDNVPLTESEAISLADTEVRIQGYHLDDYQRPKVDHSAVKGKWSLFYGPKEQSSAGGNSGPLTVTVEDKTKKVEIRK
jgi:hypothetical protein